MPDLSPADVASLLFLLAIYLLGALVFFLVVGEIFEGPLMIILRILSLVWPLVLVVWWMFVVPIPTLLGLREY